MVSEESARHQLKAPNQIASKQTNSLGYARSVNDSVSDTVPVNPTPLQKARMTMMFDEQIKKTSFGAGQKPRRTFFESLDDQNLVCRGPQNAQLLIEEDLTYGQAILNGASNAIDNFGEMMTPSGILGAIHGANTTSRAFQSFVEDSWVASTAKLRGGAVPPEIVDNFNESQ